MSETASDPIPRLSQHAAQGRPPWENASFRPVWLRHLVPVDGRPDPAPIRICLQNSLIQTCELEGTPFPQGQVLAEGAQVWDASGYACSPGFLNSHTHAPMTLLKGLGHGDQAVIEKVFFPLEKSLQAQDTEALALPFLLESLRAGVTTIADHYYFSHGVAKACERLGVRGFIGETIADLGGAFPDRAGLQKTKALIANWPFSDLIKPVLAPHAVDTVSPGLLQDIFVFAREQKLPCHMHCSQSESEFRLIQQRHGKSPVALLNELKGLWEGQLLVHLLYVSPEDLSLISQSQTSVCLCPASQMLYETLAPITQLIQRVPNLHLGTDCSACNDGANLLAEAKILLLLWKYLSGERERRHISHEAMVTMGLKLLWGQAGQFFSKYLSHPIGKLAAACKADLLFFPLDSSWYPLHDLDGRLLFSQPRPAHVMIDGQWVLWEQKPVKIREEEILSEFSATNKAVRARWGQ